MPTNAHLTSVLVAQARRRNGAKTRDRIPFWLGWHSPLYPAPSETIEAGPLPLQVSSQGGPRGSIQALQQG